MTKSRPNARAQPISPSLSASSRASHTPTPCNIRKQDGKDPALEPMDQDVIPAFETALPPPPPPTPPDSGDASASASAGAFPSGTASAAAVADALAPGADPPPPPFILPTEHAPDILSILQTLLQPMQASQAAMAASVQQLVVSGQAQAEVIINLNGKMSELAVNQSNTSVLVAGVEGRIDSIDSRLIALEAAASLPSPQPPPSTNVWGEVPNNNSQSSNWTREVPTPPPNVPLQTSSIPISHWDRLSNPTILRINSNENKVSLEAVKVAFAEFFESINLKSEHYSFDGPEVGSQFSIDITGTMAFAAKRAKYILQHVKKEDGGPNGPAVYWQFQALDVSGHGVPIY